MRHPDEPSTLKTAYKVGARARNLERRYYAAAHDWVYVGTYPGDPHTTADSPPFLNGYGNPAGIQPLRFRLTAEGSIEIEGFASGGTPGLKVFTLPAGYADGLDDTELRPVSSDLFTPAAWRIETSGDVYLESETLPTGGLEYVYSTSTLGIGDGLPGVAGAGGDMIWFDHLDLATITKLRISHFDASSNDLSALLDRWDDSTTATNRGYVYIRWIHDPAGEVRFLIFEITGDMTNEGLWDEFPISFVEHDRYVGGSGWPDGTPVAVFFFRTGDEGSTGSTGSTGATGTAGADGGIAYAYKINTGLTDPASGNLKFDTVTLGSVTNLRISHTDGPGADITALLATWDDSTNSGNRGQVFVQKTSDPSAFIAFDISGAVTDHSTWDDIPITAVASHGSFVDGDAVRVFFARSGDGGGAVSVTDGSTTVSAISQVDFVSGATVANPGGGVAQVSITASGVGAAGSAAVQEFTTSGAHTWTKPAGAKMVEVTVVGGGGGGGGSQNLAAGTNRAGGGGGGGGSAAHAVFQASELGGTVTCTVGTAGGGGSGSGASGNGGTSTFGTILSAFGGGGGQSGGTGGPVGGGGGSGFNGSTGTSGGLPNTGNGSAVGCQSTNGGALSGNSTEWGGAGGAGSSVGGGPGNKGGDSIYGGAGGSGGAGANTLNGAQAASAGGGRVNGSAGGGGAGTGGASPTNGGDATNVGQYGGGGGGGGGALSGSGAGAGGNGGKGFRGGGGGGGGAGVTTVSSGGDGGAGYIRVVTYF